MKQKMQAHEGPLRVVIYARVSTSGQAEAQTVEVQLEACRAYCAIHGYTLVAEYKDEAVSGVKPFEERPAGRVILEQAQRPDRAFDAILCYSVDRLSRAVYEGIGALRSLWRLGLQTLFVNGAYDDATPEDEAMGNLGLLFAQWDRRNTVRRLTAGRRSWVERGNFKSTVPAYGLVYNSRWSDDGKHKVGWITTDPETGPRIPELFRWYLDGMSLKRIADALDAKRVPPPSQEAQALKTRRQRAEHWHPTTVANILSNPTYTGRAIYAGIPMPCPQLVEQETFEAVQRLMQSRYRTSGRPNKRIYPLSRRVYCRICGSLYTCAPVSAGRRYSHAYTCIRRRKYRPEDIAAHEGARWWLPNDVIEPVVQQAALELYADPTQYLERVGARLELLQEEGQTRAAERDHVLRDLQALPDEEERILDLYQDGGLSKEKYYMRIRKLADERAALKGRLAQLDAEAKKARSDLRVTELFAAFAHGVAKTGGSCTDQPPELRTPEEWRDFIGQFIDKIWIEPDGQTVTIEGPGVKINKPFASCA